MQAGREKYMYYKKWNDNTYQSEFCQIEQPGPIIIKQLTM